MIWRLIEQNSEKKLYICIYLFIFNLRMWVWKCAPNKVTLDLFATSP